MKKIKNLFILLISIFVFNINVLAASGNLSVSSSNVYVGDTFTVSASISGAAAWNVHVNSSGPVSGCSINEADTTADASDTNKTFSVTCTATGEGTITITLSGDITSENDESATNISGSRSVIVSPKPTQPSNNNNSNNNNSNNNNSNNNSTGNSNNTNKSNQVVDNKSNNNNIKSLDIDGYKLTKIDNNNYTLSVSNNVTSINVKATAEDSKAKISGIGNHKLNIGDNNIEIIVTSESGVENKINIKVNRKDGYYLEELENLLNNNKINDINIIINSDTIISSKDIEKIKNSKKTVTFNYYNSDKKLMYSWTIEGSKLKNTSELSTTISYDSENKKDILRLSNYADGLYINFKEVNKLSGGIKVKIFVGNKYLDKEKVNVYLYKNDKLSSIANKLQVQNGYIEFEINDFSDYFITMSTIPKLSDNEVSNNKNTTINKTHLVIILVLTFIIAVVLAYILRKKLLKKNKFENINNNSKQK